MWSLRAGAGPERPDQREPDELQVDLREFHRRGLDSTSTGSEFEASRSLSRIANVAETGHGELLRLTRSGRIPGIPPAGLRGPEVHQRMPPCSKA